MIPEDALKSKRTSISKIAAELEKEKKLSGVEGSAAWTPKELSFFIPPM